MLNGWSADSRKEATAGFGKPFCAAKLLGGMEVGLYYPLTRAGSNAWKHVMRSRPSPEEEKDQAISRFIPLSDERRRLRAPKISLVK